MSVKPGQVPQPGEDDAPLDLSDPSAVAARNKKLKGRAARIDNGLKIIMGHPDTRAWLHELIEECKPLAEPFTGNSHTFYNCGQQSVGKRLLVKVMTNHLEEFVTMNREAKANAD